MSTQPEVASRRDPRYPDARRILFVSPRGIGRSKIAAAYLGTIVGDEYTVQTAGISPPEVITQGDRTSLLIAIVGEQIWLDALKPADPVSVHMVTHADLVVRLACPGAFPVPSGIPAIDWDVPDVLGSGPADSWRNRDTLRSKVEELAMDIGLGHHSLHVRDRPIPGQRQTSSAGQAAVPYPPQPGTTAGELFPRAEARLVVRIVDAPERAAQINNRGPLAPNFTVPWLVSAGAAASAFAKELEWRSIGLSPHLPLAEESVGLVVDWLVGEGALRPLPHDQRNALRESGRAQRRIDNPPEKWPRGLAAEYPEMAEVRFAEEDFETWQVIPNEMLRVYPNLRHESTAWKNLTR
ncbi:hypothetical protein [Curtobacterium sp. MCBD17_030]|uniref:hypothetical protein n=1 Tax=Curtobacterium sp. MCBD17_030 TaxID=2175649 RepID=UPI0011B59B6D|nr:hypothetical protein [Curtobacterium sp. MCBD17_030]